MLLDTGKVDPNAKDDDGWTPLMWAVVNGYNEIVEALLDTGRVNPNQDVRPLRHRRRRAGK